MPSDSIYIHKKSVEDFTFNSEVSNVFDDMVTRSVPLYNETQNLIVDFIVDNIKNDNSIYDLGCSTGTTLILLRRKLTEFQKGNPLIGVDLSKSMLEKAEEKIKKLNLQKINLIHGDITNDLEFEKSGCFILNLVLQFIRPINRQKILNNLFNNLKEDGILVLYEKFIDTSSFFTRRYIDMYYTFKTQNNYSQIEIAKKREELENVLIPYTFNENIDMLRKAGFKEVSLAFKYLNFGVIFAKK
ncbi:carboxy-S-adenosyl-L-methionine synthase CmoA [Bacillus stercoris]|uniref:carboxy-S-adenosyl-L-methionine synthase CmoA n=1 Tax=Bacillus subtilis group TaxID=653685 RepID=UPI0024441CDC|nr:carboxy-S-adenosyl-L-methionine synthase CmoA [Bacillus stercoris]WGE40995.1 carboxy-S-adenosyl-L-methionine synthase CmoA [Bacillus stercoris]